MKKMMYCKCALSLVAAVLLVSLADAATYDFTNTAGGSFDESANWKGGSVPPVSDTSASLMFTNVTSGSTVTLGDGHYAWKEMTFGSGKYGATTDNDSDWYFSGGSLSIANKIYVSGGTLHLASQLYGATTNYAHGTKFYLESNQTNDVAIGAWNGRMKLNGTLTSGSALRVDGNGTLELPVDQTVARLGGGHKAGRVEIAEGRTLTLNGAAGETDVFSGNLFGAGTLDKKGADYTLVFDGDHTTNHPFAGTLSVSEGDVILKSARTFAKSLSPTVYWSFDDPANPGKADVSANDLVAYTWDNGHVAGGSNISSKGANGAGIHVDGTTFLGKSAGAWPRNNDAFSFLCWARIDPSTSGRVQLLGFGNKDSHDTQFSISVKDNGGIAIYDSYYQTSDHLTINANLEKGCKDGRWHSFAATFDGATLVAYVDGSFVASTNRTFNMTDTWTYFDLGISGAGSSGSRTVHDVWLDEVAMYKRALTSEEVAACHAAFRPYYETETTAPVTLPDPVAWYRFDDAANPGKDSSGNGYDLTANGSSLVKSGSPISGGMFSGTKRNYLKWGAIGASTELPARIPRGTSPVSVSLWANAVGAKYASSKVSWAMFGLGARQIGIQFNEGWRRLQLFEGNTTTQVIGKDLYVTKEESATAWHHIAFSYDGSGYSFYVDGRLQGTKTYSNAIPDDALLLIGQSSKTTDASSQYFEGNIDEVKIYDEALTAEQIAADYRSELPRTGDVIAPETDVAVASGAGLVVDGAIQTFTSVPTGAGTIRLNHDATLVLAPSGAETLHADVTGKGTLRIAGGNVAISGNVAPGIVVEVTNAVLSLAQGAALSAPVVLCAGGRISADSALDADVTVKDGGLLNFAGPLTTTGVLSLEQGFAVDCGGNDWSNWTTVATALKIEATQEVLDSAVFESKTQNAVGVLRLVDGTTLQARCRPAKGIIIIVQ